MATESKNESGADKAELQNLDERANEAEDRALASEDRADQANDRVDRLEHRVDIHEELIAELQQEGLVSRKHAHNLEQALRSARLIGSAVGIVMANRKLSEEDAFRTLGKASQNTNVKLRLVAEEVVRTGDVSPLPEV
jgi:hypothetical protein